MSMNKMRMKTAILKISLTRAVILMAYLVCIRVKMYVPSSFELRSHTDINDDMKSVRLIGSDHNEKNTMERSWVITRLMSHNRRRKREIVQPALSKASTR